jgi:hypothetical protein
MAVIAAGCTPNAGPMGARLDAGVDAPNVERREGAGEAGEAEAGPGCPRSLAEACCGPGERVTCPLDWSGATTCGAWGDAPDVRVYDAPCAGYVAVRYRTARGQRAQSGTQVLVYDAARGGLVATLAGDDVDAIDAKRPLRCEGGPPRFAAPPPCVDEWAAPVERGLGRACAATDAGPRLRYCDAVDQSAVGAASE